MLRHLALSLVANGEDKQQGGQGAGGKEETGGTLVGESDVLINLWLREMEKYGGEG